MSQKSATSRKTGKNFAVRVAILMGSDSDLPTMKESAMALQEFGIRYEIKILSAHRAPKDTAAYAESACERGIRVFIAGAGGAAHLPGVVASLTELPVIGVPIAHGALNGVDALYSIVQMPRGVPVATVAIGGAFNAGLLAVQILACGGEKQDTQLLERFMKYKQGLRQKVLAQQQKT